MPSGLPLDFGARLDLYLAAGISIVEAAAGPLQIFYRLWAACNPDDDTLNIAALLLDRGAKVEARDNKGYTALIWAAQQGHTDLVAMLVM